MLGQVDGDGRGLVSQFAPSGQAQAHGVRMPEGLCPATRHRHLWHNRTTVPAGQRVMRHFLRADLILRHPTPVPIAIALLALRVLATTLEAALIALPAKTLRLPARRLAAVR